MWLCDCPRRGIFKSINQQRDTDSINVAFSFETEYISFEEAVDQSAENNSIIS